MKKQILLPILLTCLMLSFQNDKLPQKNTIYPQIIGKWKLLSRSGGIAGASYPVDTTQKNQLTFNQDGTYSSDMANVKEKGAYGVIFIPSTKSYILRYYKGNDINSYGIDNQVIVRNDTLYLNMEAVDGINCIFLRR